MAYEHYRITEFNGESRLEVSFTLGKNEKRTSEKAPQYRGYSKESGVAASAWVREHEGRKFFSGTIQIPLDKLREFLGVDAPGKGFVDDKYGAEEIDEDIPF